MTEVNSITNKQALEFQNSIAHKLRFTSRLWLIVGVLELLLGIDFFIPFLLYAKGSSVNMLINMVFIFGIVLLGCASITVFRRNIEIKNDIKRCDKKDILNIILLLAVSLFTCIIYLQLETMKANPTLSPLHMRIPSLFGYFSHHYQLGIFNKQGFMYGEIGGVITYRFISVLLIIAGVMIASFNDMLNIENAMKNRLYYLGNHTAIQNKRFPTLILLMIVIALVVAYTFLNIMFIVAEGL